VNTLCYPGYDANGRDYQRSVTVARIIHSQEKSRKSVAPDIPSGKSGWDAKGDLDLGLIGRLAKERDGRMLGGSQALLSGLPRPSLAELDT
jgi:hypothetical protein